MNNSLVNALNAAIEKRGFRISPRLPLGDRLARYTQLYYESHGRWIDSDDARTAASMLMLKHSDLNAQNTTLIDDSSAATQPLKAPRRPSTTKAVTSVPPPTQSTHHMMRRSQVGPR